MHFNCYQETASEFAELIEIDPWLVNPLFRNCGQIDFMKREGEDCLVRHTEALLNAIREKYREYRIDQKPYVVVKADTGTYGMGVMTISSIDEIQQLNRKQRTRMSTTKGNQTVTKVILQEGVYTKETVGPQHSVAEPVIYLIGSSVIGGFYRVHEKRGESENLNAPGMRFEAMPELEHMQDVTQLQAKQYAFAVVARLAGLAAAKEIQTRGCC